MSDFLATFYVAFFVLYTVGALTAIFYASYLRNNLRRIEDEAKERLMHHENNKRHNHDCECDSDSEQDNESTHKSNPTQPLLGVVWPPTGDAND